ncbi:hypothetical protein TRVL_02911 [Trypanosoma vivax]|uniref:Uncharacterized protein n=1 Tax=Trypanosoma vivax (strain Y486) TaxID=1055687 RepID=G0TYM9_TRYVY|nr:hypothetical protein TRVL_02911 [Trypanosoma vivax]CCC49076.1 hypothetical protein, unlikely [Trypanosoma vivax Y486]
MSRPHPAITCGEQKVIAALWRHLRRGEEALHSRYNVNCLKKYMKILKYILFWAIASYFRLRAYTLSEALVGASVPSLHTSKMVKLNNENKSPASEIRCPLVT